MNDEPFTIRESVLAERLGLTQRDVAKERKLFEQGRDWDMVEKRVLWTLEASMRLAAALDITLLPADLEASEPSGGAGTPATEEKLQDDAPSVQHTEEMTVVRWRFPNERIIQCRRQDGSLVFVRVRSSKNFRPFLSSSTASNPKPMTLRAYRDHTAWALVGNCPRWPGKW